MHFLLSRFNNGFKVKLMHWHHNLCPSLSAAWSTNTTRWGCWQSKISLGLSTLFCDLSSKLWCSTEKIEQPKREKECRLLLQIIKTNQIVIRSRSHNTISHGASNLRWQQVSDIPERSYVKVACTTPSIDLSVERQPTRLLLLVTWFQTKSANCLQQQERSWLCLQHFIVDVFRRVKLLTCQDST